MLLYKSSLIGRQAYLQVPQVPEAVPGRLCILIQQDLLRLCLIHHVRYAWRPRQRCKQPPAARATLSNGALNVLCLCSTHVHCLIHAQAAAGRMENAVERPYLLPSECMSCTCQPALMTLRSRTYHLRFLGGTTSSANLSYLRWHVHALP